MRPFGFGAFVGALLFATSWPASGQTVDRFEDLGLQVNLGDTVQVEDQTGVLSTGRLVGLTRREIAVRTEVGETRLTVDRVRGVAVRRHPMKMSALVGTAAFAALGAVARCQHEGGGDCGVVGALAAAPIGAGAGLAVGSLVSRMRPIYRARVDGPSQPPIAAPSQPSLLEELGPRVNLGDRLRVQDESGSRMDGRLVRLADDALALQTRRGEQRLIRGTIRQVDVHRRPLRAATLAGVGAGAAFALSQCRGEDNECPDGVLIGASLGAGLGFVTGALLDRTTIVYPEESRKPQTIIAPLISRGAAGILVARRW